MGHYKAEEWAADDNKWMINDRLGIQITVDVSTYPFGYVLGVIEIPTRADVPSF